MARSSSLSGSGSLGNTLLNFLNNLFSSIASPISGYDIEDVKVKSDGDNFSSLFQFTNVGEDGESLTSLKDNRTGEDIKDIEGNKIEVALLLQTTNAQTVLDPLFTGMNAIGAEPKDFPEKEQLLNVLLGTDREDDEVHEQNGKGLLGYKFDADADPKKPSAQYDGNTWSWAAIIEALQFSLECQSPGKDYGAIESQNISNCGKLIGEYLEKVGLTKSASEVSIDVSTLVIPILAEMQKTLIEYFNNAVSQYAPDGIEYDKETPEAQSRAVFDQDGNFVEHIDISTPEGAAKAEEYQAKGYQVGASKHIDVTLQKITGTSAIKMTAIKASYNYGDVLDDIDEIINQAEFTQTLPEEPTSYSIDVDADGFDITECDECIECNPCESLCELFKAGIRAYRNLYIIHWMSYGNDMMKLHILAEEMYGELIQEIDTIGELLVEKQGTVPQLDFPCDYVPVQNYDFQSGLLQIQSLINIYIDCIDYAYCNQDSDVQSTLDEWLRYWKKQMRYFVERQEMA